MTQTANRANKNCLAAPMPTIDRSECSIPTGQKNTQMYFFHLIRFKLVGHQLTTINVDQKVIFINHVNDAAQVCRKYTNLLLLSREIGCNNSWLCKGMSYRLFYIYTIPIKFYSKLLMQILRPINVGVMVGQRCKRWPIIPAPIG